MANKKHTTGLTLIEVMVAVFIIAVAVIGAMGFRFYCVTDAKKADVQINAVRIGSMLLENWKANIGDTHYNPYTQFATFSQLAITPNAEVGPSNTYKVYDNANSNGTSGGTYYFVTLSRTGGMPPTPTELNVRIWWLKNYTDKTDSTNPIVHTILMTAYTD
jgi:hypothetical protein